MSWFYHDPDEWEAVVDHRPCTACDGDWRRCTGRCNGFMSVGQKRRDPEEVAKIKAERLRQEEDRIMAEAENIKRRRGATDWFVGHHIWCNFAGGRPAADCSLCKSLNARFPMDGKSPEEMMASFFPDAKVVGSHER